MALPWLPIPSANPTSPKAWFPLNTTELPISCSSARRRRRAQRWCFVTKCATNSESGKAELKVGSPIVIVETPLVVKTATPMPSLRANTGQVKAGDVGRVVARKPKDVWAIRLAIGTYLLDGKYFRPFDEED